MSFLRKLLEKWREKRKSSRPSALAGGSSQEVNVTVSQPPIGESEQDVVLALESHHDQIDQEESTRSQNLDPPHAAVLRPEVAKAPVTPPKSIWNNAYDKLVAEEPKLVQAYEKILSFRLSPESADSLDLTTKENTIKRDNVLLRRAQMHQLIYNGLDKTAREAKAKENMGIALQVVNATKKLVTDAIRDIPQAALPWAVVSVSLEMLMNPVSETKANQEGIEYIGTTIQWYWEQAARLFDKDDGANKTLQAAFVDLYRDLLQFQMSSICNYYGNRGFVLLRDVVKLDDWEGKLRSIRKNDDALREKINTFLGLESKSLLKDLVDHTKVQEQYHQTKEDQQCLIDLRITDPRADRSRIEDTKGGLLHDSYRWILENPQFRSWRERDENSLLWLRGDPGKGKTMLLCGLVQELMHQSDRCLVTFFFCQATIPRINNHVAVLRGLMWLLAIQRPSLISHIRKAYDTAGKSAFTEANAWYTLSEVFKNMLGDEELPPVYIVIDALDECTIGMKELLDFIQKASRLANVKWVVSSRNWTDIEEKLNQGTSLSLEVNATLVETAVDAYISQKASQIPILRQDDKLKEEVCSRIREKANGTFLWAAIVIQRLSSKTNAFYDDISEILGLLDEVPENLSNLYAVMLKRTAQLEGKRHELCRIILAIATLAYRPLHLDELSTLAGFQGRLRELTVLQDLIKDCGSFLTVRENVVYFIHQSAKDFLADGIFPDGEETIHYKIVSNSLDAMAQTLRENVYGLAHLGVLFDDISTPDPDPLRHILYSCNNWVAHLCAVISGNDNGHRHDGLVDDDKILGFLETHLLHWLEALSLKRNVSGNISSIRNLYRLLKHSLRKDELEAFVYDVSRFMQYHVRIMESAPLQIYASALIFSPTGSLVRRRFSDRLSSWILSKPVTASNWSPHIQVIEAKDPKIVASSSTNLLILDSDSQGVEIWEIALARRVQVLNHTETVEHAMFLGDLGLVLTFTERLTCSWDVNSGDKVSESSIQDLDIDWKYASVSSDGRLVASLTDDGIQICDVVQKTKRQISNFATSLGNLGAKKLRWSNDYKLLACGALVMRLSDVTGGIRQLKFIDASIYSSISTGLSMDSKLIAVPGLKKVTIWDSDTEDKISTLAACGAIHFFIAEFSKNGKLIAASSIFRRTSGFEQGVNVWDVATGELLHQLCWEGKDPAEKLVWLGDSMALAVVCAKSVVIYDLPERTFRMSRAADEVLLESSHLYVMLICSADFTRLAAVSSGPRICIGILDTTTGNKIQELYDDPELIRQYTFSPDSKSLYGHSDSGVVAWDIATGKQIRTPLLALHAEQPAKSAMSRGGKYLAAALSEKEKIILWDLPQNKVTQELITHRKGESVFLLALSNNAEYIASLSVWDDLEVWNVATGKMIWGAADASLSSPCPASISVSDDGERVLFTGPHQRICVVEKGKKGFSLQLCYGVCEPCFDVESPYILTQCGRFDLDKVLAQAANDLQPAHCYQAIAEGYGLSHDNEWIIWNGQNIVWLPPSYRPEGKRVIARHGLAMVTSSGNPCIFRFTGRPPPFKSLLDSQH